ncbi:MAG: carboxypeptidase regulatory-like domain-containing protein [Pirellulaceae bacterium]|nr:carboxypeptidase regulatory-like domain-containing protein [Pirellulaceae bacterium]
MTDFSRLIEHALPLKHSNFTTTFIHVKSVSISFLLLFVVSCVLGQESATDTSALEASSQLLVAGSVVDTSGRPVSGARVVIRRKDHRYHFEDYLYYGEKYSEFDQNFGEGLTDRAGKFRLALKEPPPAFPLTVVAHRVGHAPSSASYSGQNEVRIQLGAGATIRGSIVDEDENPVTSARVRLASWFNYKNNQTALARQHSGVEFEGHLVGETIRVETRSSGDGTFRLNDLPHDRWLVLVIEADGFLPKCVVADTGNDPALESAGDALRFFDDGTIRLKRATRVEFAVVAQETQQPIRIQEAFTAYKLWLQTSDPLTERAKKLEVRGNRAILSVLPPRENRFWLIPDPSSGYMAAMLDVDGADTTEGHRRIDVEVQRGARVVGRVVDEQTNKPIEGVAIHYEPESMAELLESGASVPSVRSDKNGEFAMNVPPIEGWLRQIGRVDGYRSVYLDYNQDIRRVAPAHKISPTLEAETRVEFRLRLANRVTGQVVDSQGRPVAHARFAARERVTQSGYGDILGTADSHGRFELRNIFAEMLLETPAGETPGSNQPTSETIYFWSQDRQLTATVKVPYPTESQPDLDLKIVLVPASSIRGRMVDLHTSEGVSAVQVGVKFLAGPSSGAFASFATQSDLDGYFTIKPIFADSEFKLAFQGEYIGYKAPENATMTVPAGTEYSIGEIPLFVYRDLEQLLEVPDISKQTTMEAVGTLQTALERVRARILEVQEWQSGQSSTDSISIAEMTTAERFGEAFLRLSERTSDSDMAFKVLVDYLTNIDSDWAPSFYAGRAKKALLDRFLDRGEILEILPRVLSNHDIAYWRHVYDHANSEPVKALACRYLIDDSLSNLPFMATWEGFSDKQFLNKLVEAKKLWRYASSEVDNASSARESLKHSTDNRLRQTLRQLQNMGAPNPTRIDKLRQAIEEQLSNDSSSGGEQ